MALESLWSIKDEKYKVADIDILSTGEIVAIGFNGQTDIQPINAYIYIYSASNGLISKKIDEAVFLGAFDFTELPNYPVPSISAIPTSGFIASFNGGPAPYFVKYSQEGERILSVSLPTQSANDPPAYYITDSAASKDGSFCIGGFYAGYVFDGAKTSDDGFDSFLVKYDIDGNKTWSRPLAEPGEHRLTSLTIDSLGNIYACGTNSYLKSITDIDKAYFVSSYTPSGDLRWTTRDTIINGLGLDEYSKNNYKGSIFDSTDIPTDIAVSASGSIFVVGSTESDLALEGFIARYNQDGTLVWRQKSPHIFDSLTLGRDMEIIAFAPYRDEGVSSYPRDGAHILTYSASGKLLANQTDFIGNFQAPLSDAVGTIVSQNNTFYAAVDFLDQRGFSQPGGESYTPRITSFIGALKLDSNNDMNRPDFKPKDVLTGQPQVPDLYKFNKLRESRLGKYVSISNFEPEDAISVNRELYRPTFDKYKGRIATLKANLISKIVGKRSFKSLDYALFEAGNDDGMYLCINDKKKGFKAESDGIFFLQGLDPAALQARMGIAANL